MPGSIPSKAIAGVVSLVVIASILTNKRVRTFLSSLFRRTDDEEHSDESTKRTNGRKQSMKASESSMKEDGQKPLGEQTARQGHQLNENIPKDPNRNELQQRDNMPIRVNGQPQPAVGQVQLDNQPAQQHMPAEQDNLAPLDNNMPAEQDNLAPLDNNIPAEQDNLAPHNDNMPAEHANGRRERLGGIADDDGGLPNAPPGAENVFRNQPYRKKS